ncbi:putative ctl transporter [Erysiphe necator]|uniref:Protein PNS1 n=1 Tax=Uncinula necator TaxID=52586 RepID=A0A0B1PCQ7_UNCNE|nr:putative ctl transporter [Erysiphe necator]
MFSEYASRFLAQSQSRISNFVQPADNAEASYGTQHERYRRISQPFRNLSRGYLPRPGNPYQTSSHLSNFNFASRFSGVPDAPLFHSALDEFREDDEAERERETADLFALQKSRRVFTSARLEDSSETDLEISNESLDSSRNNDEKPFRGRGLGIRSSWTGFQPSTRGRERTSRKITGEDECQHQEIDENQLSMSGMGRDKMEEIGLGSLTDNDDSLRDRNYEMSITKSPPPFQHSRSAPKKGNAKLRLADSQQISQSSILQPPEFTGLQPMASPLSLGEIPMNDVFWGYLFLICLGGMFATFFLIFLHTETPTTTLGDTIYTTLHSSFYLLAVDTVVSIFVSLLWLALLKSFVKPLVYLILVIVPIVLFSFSLYPFIASFKNTSSRQYISDQALRWLSLIPGIFSFAWGYTIYRERYSLKKAVGILEFASKILAANPGLLVMGFSVLGAVVCWTWIWLGMFTRVFLGGRLSTSLARFVIETSSWWLGVNFILMYIWTLSVISGIQRSTTAATVSEWYFHRNIKPPPNSTEVVTAAFMNAITTEFGTISLISLISLLIRLPLLVLPRRIVGLLSILIYSWIPTQITTLTNPLTLTYAAVHSQPLHVSARNLSQTSFLSFQSSTNNLTQRSFYARNYQQSPILPYRLAKIILHATRFIMAIGLGFSGWVATAKRLKITSPEGNGIRGSSYAYVVGLVAGFIGWGVLSAVEGILSGVVDAIVICWESEKGTSGAGTYCAEAGFLFGEAR